MSKSKKTLTKKQKLVLDVQNADMINENVAWTNLELKKPLSLTAKTEHQKLLFKSIEDNLITFAVGSAGSGKTMISVNRCLDEFVKGNYDKMIFTRPCIEANGENLGFLPGNLNDKISPYMMPIFDFLSDYLDYKQVESMIRAGYIQTLPLAYMRGCTFRNAFVIGDEFQNTKPEQVKMFLTRIGENCKIVITGDPKQSDIKGKNGLAHAIELFADTDQIGIVEFNEEDILRHPMVAIIEKKYNGYSSNGNGNGNNGH
jgi:phosphate starvation-inducible protein PhoH and related proteins